MSDLLDDIMKAISENGVCVRFESVTENSCEGETVIVKKFSHLDFSEHDKAFEDKIAKLENQIARLDEEKSFLRTRCMPYVEKDFDNGLYGKLAIVGCNEEFVDIQKYADGDDLYSREVRNLISEGGIKRLIGQYRNLSSRLDKMSDENKGLKQRIAELEEKNKNLVYMINELQLEKAHIDCDLYDANQRIAELESKNNQLTESILRKETKIHELESKEVEKPTKLNLNDRIKVKLTPLGAEIYYHQYDEVNKRIKENGGTELEPIMPQIDKDRYTEFQLWHFVELYGEHIGMCKKNVIDPLDIIISE